MVLSSTLQTRRTVAYSRVSTEEQAIEGYSLADQDRQCRRYAEARDWPAVDELYADAGVSGTTRDRPALNRLLTDAKAGVIGRVICTKLDRIGRRAADILAIEDELDTYGVERVYIKDSIDTSSPTGRLLRTVLAAVAELERDMILERTRSGFMEKARRGETWRSGPMYGYRYIPGDKRAGIRGRLEIDEATAPIVRCIFEALANGVSASRLAAQLNAEGVPTVLGGTWRHATILYLIKNPTYTGETTWGATETVKGKRRRATDAAAIQHIAVPPLVSLELAQAARDAVARQRTWAKRNAKHNYLLRGLMVCAHCQSTLVGSAKAYRCACYRVPQEHIEEDIKDRIAGILTNPTEVLSEHRALADASSQQSEKATAEVARLERAATEVERQQGRLLDVYLAGYLDETTFGTKSAELSARHQALVDEAASVTAHRSSALAGLLPLDDIEAACAFYASKLDSLTPDQWQHLVRLFCTRITVTREVAEVEGVLPKAGASVPLSAIAAKRLGSLNAP